MSTRLDTIKRMAETDPYWRAYLDGMNDTHAVGRADDRSAEFAEHARLLEARLDRATTHRPSFMSDKISMDEARAKAARDRKFADYLAASEQNRTMAREDYDNQWTPVPNSADLGSPRIP